MDGGESLYTSGSLPLTSATLMQHQAFLTIWGDDSGGEAETFVSRLSEGARHWHYGGAIGRRSLVC